MGLVRILTLLAILTFVLSIAAGCTPLPERIMDTAADRGCEYQSIQATDNRVEVTCK